jgi:electron transfer flavoprotein beta subunit
VITTDLRLNEPRYISLPNIVQAKRKTLTVLPLTELAVDVTPRLKILSVTTPPQRAKGVKVSSIVELLAKLKNEARVLT